MMEWKKSGTQLYQQLLADCTETMKEIEPPRENPEKRPDHEQDETHGCH